MNKKLALLALGLFSLSGAAQATLQGRDLNGSAGSFEAYFDTDLNITWLADANYGAGSSYDDGVMYQASTTDGRMSWANANAWAASLSIVDSINNITYDNWRLPSTLQPDFSCHVQPGNVSDGYGCSGSELGHLFYTELGGVQNSTISATHNANYSLFQNLKSDIYWSGTEYVYSSAGYAWAFYFHTGSQDVNNKNYVFYALAVSPGDVGAVPEPETYAMILAGLGLLGFVAHRRKQKGARGIN